MINRGWELHWIQKPKVAASSIEIEQRFCVRLAIRIGIFIADAGVGRKETGGR